MKTFVVLNSRTQDFIGHYTTTASTAFSKGGAMGAPNASDVLAYASAGTHPYAFLLNEVTTDGLSYEEMMHNPGLASEEVKAGKNVLVVLNKPGLMVATDNIASDWDGSAGSAAIGDEVEVGSNGVLQKTTVGTHAKIGKVIDVDYLADGNSDCIVVQMFSNDLGDSAVS
jgi:hypothetical protein